MVYFLAREAKGHGVPEVIEAVAVRNGRIRPRVVAADLVNPQMTVITRDEDLADCMIKFERTGNEHLPVIENTKSRRLIGMISRQDIINLYNKEILRKEFLGIKFERQQENGRTRDVVELTQRIYD